MTVSIKSVLGVFQDFQQGVIWISTVIMVIFMSNYWKKIVTLVKSIFVKHPIGTEIEQNWDITKDLVELRAVADSDRAYVFRFHNGTEFLPSHPVWKITCTHEIVRPGVGYQAGRVQGVLVSLIPEIISSVIIGGANHPGIYSPECLDCPNKIQCRKDNKRVVVFQVQDMEGSFSRFHFENQNTKTSILGGITNNGSVCGMVGIDFTGVRLPDEKVQEAVNKVCLAVNSVKYHLLTKKEQIQIDNGNPGSFVTRLKNIVK